MAEGVETYQVAPIWAFGVITVVAIVVVGLLIGLALDHVADARKDRRRHQEEMARSDRLYAQERKMEETDQKIGQLQLALRQKATAVEVDTRMRELRELVTGKPD